MRNRTYGGVRGRKTKVGEKLLRFPPTRFLRSLGAAPVCGYEGVDGGLLWLRGRESDAVIEVEPVFAQCASLHLHLHHLFLWYDQALENAVDRQSRLCREG